MNASPDMAQRKELGEFVRACRERLRPDALGIPTGQRRRTPGLRREEVAQISGLSTTWYTWLEQGRDISASPSALSRLARALRLSRAERIYLFELSGERDPDRDASGTVPLPEALRDCVHVINTPAYILDQAWNALAWNSEAEQLFIGWLDTGNQPNLLRYIFLSETARRLIHDFEGRARRVVAEFRADVSTHLDSADVRALLDELRGESALFAQLWEDHTVLEREGGQRHFDHPAAGLLAFRQVTFNVANRPEMKMTMLLKVE